MAVKFALDDPQPRDDQPPRRSRKPGTHARTTDDQVCLDALAALLRGDAEAASRYLSRLPPQVLGYRLLPAVRELGRTAAALAGAPTAGRRAPPD